MLNVGFLSYPEFNPPADNMRSGLDEMNFENGLTPNETEYNNGFEAGLNNGIITRKLNTLSSYYDIGYNDGMKAHARTNRDDYILAYFKYRDKEIIYVSRNTANAQTNIKHTEIRI